MLLKSLGALARVGACLTLPFTLAHSGFAQSWAPGQRVRVLSRGGATAPIVGTLVRARSDSVWLTPSGSAETRAVALGTARVCPWHAPIGQGPPGAYTSSNR